MYILSQIAAFIVLIITLISYHLKHKKKIFKIMCLSNIFNIIHYLCLGAYSGCITKTIALARNLFIVKKENNKKLDKLIYLILFIGVYIISGVLTYNNLYSLLPLISATIFMIVTWNGKELQIKRIAIYCYFLWLLYNILIFSIVGIIANTISLISTFIAYQNYKRYLKNRR